MMYASGDALSTGRWNDGEQLVARLWLASNVDDVVRVSWNNILCVDAISARSPAMIASQSGIASKAGVINADIPEVTLPWWPRAGESRTTDDKEDDVSASPGSRYVDGDVYNVVTVKKTNKNATTATFVEHRRTTDHLRQLERRRLTVLASTTTTSKHRTT